LTTDGSDVVSGVPSQEAAIGEIAAGYQALRRAVGVIELRRDVVTVEGPDATSFLQGQLSQDITPLRSGQDAAALLLEPDGKLTALVRVTRIGDHAYLLDTDAGFGDVAAARLCRFRLRTKVEVAVAQWPCVALRGAGVDATLVGSPEGDSGSPWVLPVEWNGTRGLDVLGPGAESTVPASAHRCVEGSWEALRIEAGIPSMGAELDSRTIAAEAGLVDRTVSFTKGCYTGQELVARLDARGNRVARRLCGIVARSVGFADTSSLLGAVLARDGDDKPVGRCTSVAWSPAIGGCVALAYVHRSVELPATLLAEARAGAGASHRSIEVTACGLPIVES